MLHYKQKQNYKLLFCKSVGQVYLVTGKFGNISVRFQQNYVFSLISILDLNLKFT